MYRDRVYFCKTSPVRGLGHHNTTSTSGSILLFCLFTPQRLAVPLAPNTGHIADYFTLAVRTGSEGFGGISLLLVDAKS